MSSSPLAKTNVKRGSLYLHSWVGLLLGWLCLLIFLTGTISFYRAEQAIWLAPELHVEESKKVNLQLAIGYLEQHAQNAKNWNINLPNERNHLLVLGWRAPKGTESNTIQPANGQIKTRKGGVRVYLDPNTGEVLNPRSSRFFDFLYRMHFELYGIDRFTGRLIMGIATLGMLIALISGIIIHHRIFKDFFTFTPKKKLRSWLDFHNVTSVLALPFHIVLTYSGLMLLMFVLMPWGVNIALDGDNRPIREATGGKMGHSEFTLPSDGSVFLETSKPLGQAISNLITSPEAQQQWPN
ncbi:MAG: PepSY-associated TM helix domain-containing protein, partial [Parashewanella sp.]